MSAKSKILHSRNAWRAKNSLRVKENANLRRALQRSKAREQALKDENLKLTKENKRLDSQGTPSLGNSKPEVIFLVLILFCDVRISFHAISRLLQRFVGLGLLTKAPCVQTICNWVSKLSLVRIWQGPKDWLLSPLQNLAHNGLIYLIDESIGCSGEKILVILALPLNFYTNNIQAPALKHLRIVASLVSSSWTGEKIFEILKELIPLCGRPAAYLVDGGANLHKALRLLQEQGLGSFLIRDISHIVANLLKNYYEQNPYLEAFLKACGDAASQFKQTILACLTPPTLRTKARFMNLQRLMKWAKNILSLSPVGRAKSGSVLEKMRQMLGVMPKFKNFILEFHSIASNLLQIQAILKKNGLHVKSYTESLEHLQNLPANHPIRQGLEDWFHEHLQLAQELHLAEAGLPCSTDPLESLFGLSKSHGILKNMIDPARMALKIGALVGRVTMEDATAVMNLKHADFIKALPTKSFLKNRNQIFNGTQNIENLSSQLGKNSDYYLMPSPKNQTKIEYSNKKSGGCEISLGPQNHAPPKPIYQLEAS